MRMIKLCNLLALLITWQLAIPSSAIAQKLTYQYARLIRGNDTLNYRILYPKRIDQEKVYPLILFLHGSGERGHDNEKQLLHGGNYFSSESNSEQFPAVVVFPQCATNDYWANVTISEQSDSSRSFMFNPSAAPTTSMNLTMALIDSLLQTNWINKKQVYIGGLSMGGMGAFELLYRKPEVFAAAFPICGGGNPELINNMVKEVQVWAFHGADDPVVPPHLSEKMINAITKAGANARLTLFPNTGHNAWDRVFSSPELLQWLSTIQKE